MTRARPGQYTNYGFGPSSGFHVLKDKWNQRSYIHGHVSALVQELSEAIGATKKAAQVRSDAAHHFGIDIRRPRERHAFRDLETRTDERGLEQRLYREYGPNADQLPSPVWEQLVAYQVPLFNTRRTREGWGHVDLLAVSADLQPVVIELKHEAADDTPLRTLLECVANMIGVEANWERIASEVRSLSPLDGRFASQDLTTVAPVGVLLAPIEYWDNWAPFGAFAHRISADTRRAFQELRGSLASAGYPTKLASVSRTGDGRPQVHEVTCGW